MKGRRRRIFARIYRRVIKVRGPLDTPCWIWQGTTSGNGRGGGYARFKFGGVTAAVHRVMYELWHGPIEPRKQIDHLCRNRLCVNPLHLEQVNQSKNVKRRYAAEDNSKIGCET